MKRCLTMCIFGVALFGAISLSAGAQAPAGAALRPHAAAAGRPREGVSGARRFPSTRCPTSSSCRPACTSARAWAWPPIRKATSSSSLEAASSRLFEFDQNGTFVHEIGTALYGFAMAHAVRVDAQDNIWTVDEGTNMVVKWNAADSGPVLMLWAAGHEAAEGLIPHRRCRCRPRSTTRFNRPTDIAWDPQGNIFISDGYNNSRVVKYDKNGRFIKARSATRGAEPTQINTPHSMQVDAKGNVYVADRGNNRIQVFDNNLKLRDDLRPTSARRGRCASRPGRISISTARIRIPISNPPSMRAGDRRDLQDGARRQGARQASARRARRSESSARSTRWTAGTRTRCAWRRSPRGACRKSTCKPASRSGVEQPITSGAMIAAEALDESRLCNSLCSAAAVLLAQHLAVRAARDPEIPYDSAPNLLKGLPDRHVPRRGGGRGDQLARAHLRLHADRLGDVTIGTERTFVRQRRLAAVRVRPDRQVRPRDRPGLYGFVFAHVVRVDPQDNIWVVDEGANLVMKFDPQGQRR